MLISKSVQSGDRINGTVKYDCDIPCDEQLTIILDDPDNVLKDNKVKVTTTLIQMHSINKANLRDNKVNKANLRDNKVNHNNKGNRVNHNNKDNKGIVYQT